MVDKQLNPDFWFITLEEHQILHHKESVATWGGLGLYLKVKLALNLSVWLANNCKSDNLPLLDVSCS